MVSSDPQITSSDLQVKTWRQAEGGCNEPKDVQLINGRARPHASVLITDPVRYPLLHDCSRLPGSGTGGTFGFTKGR